MKISKYGKIKIELQLRIRIMIWQATPEHITRQNPNSKRHMHLYSHSKTIHNSQDMETIWKSINTWMDKEDVVHIYNGILLHHKRNKIVPFMEMWIDLETVITEWSKSEREKQILHNIAYM